MDTTFLHELVVVEFGDRLATGLCGGLLQRLGADVVVIESPKMRDVHESKWRYRAQLRAGKRAIALDPWSKEGAEKFGELLRSADVLVTSSDWRPELPPQLQSELAAAVLVCDVSAFGSTGPMAGAPYTDSMMQAFSGLMDTTGMPDDEPVPTAIPVAECTAAIYAAAGTLAGLRGRRMHAGAQRVEVALFDTAVSLLSTFLPKHFVGQSPGRIGNRHPSMAPWNAFAARDGWVLLCSASNDMWHRICDVIEKPQLKNDPRFASMQGRVQNTLELDNEIRGWIAARSVDTCVRRFIAESVPCGPVCTVHESLSDPNIRARGAVREIADSLSGHMLLVPGPLFHGAPATGRAPANDLSMHDASQARNKRESVTSQIRPSKSREDGVLAGIRVLEMGSYTTAPLAARNLGALGAYVVKLEPPSGELSRASPPYNGDQSFLCTLSNSDKRSVAVDLRTPEGRELFAILLSRADVFVENMKPGMLAKFGFDQSRICGTNPGMIYCSISGYGADAPFADRPAMDATIQGMAGIMDSTRSRGVPYKIGVSISDILGGQFALVAILAALECRERTGRGQYIDLSMLELSSWLTQFYWNEPGRPESEGDLLRCSDGYVLVETGRMAINGSSAEFESRTRYEALARLAEKGVSAVCVNTVDEVVRHPHTIERGLIVQKPAANGSIWPLLACPIRLSSFPVITRRALGRVGEDLDEVLRDWGIGSSVASPTPVQKEWG